jgi:hypothetical protein
MKAIHGTAFRAMLRLASLSGGDFAVGRYGLFADEVLRRLIRSSTAVDCSEAVDFG